MSKKIDQGFAYDPELNTVYHFGHIPIKDAENRAGQENPSFIVETINWTYANGDKSMVHLNQFFAKDLNAAVRLTHQLHPLLKEVAENIFSIRMATEEEAERFKRASELFNARMPEAIHDSDIPE